MREVLAEQHGPRYARCLSTCHYRRVYVTNAEERSMQPNSRPLAECKLLTDYTHTGSVFFGANRAAARLANAFRSRPAGALDVLAPDSTSVAS